MEWNYKSLASIASAARQAGTPISTLVLRQQAAELGASEREMYNRMAARYRVMAQSAEAGSRPGLRSASGLSGGDAAKLQQALERGSPLCGTLLGHALQRALAVSEYNAAMGRIVAAPTAGSCGILPAALLTLQREGGKPEPDCVMALFTAGAVGLSIAQNASLAGAEGGCQAECGSAAAMAAAALAELCGGTPEQCVHAVALALKNLLGLVCDPVAGLVEIPCIKRNAGGVATAFTAAELALAGVESAIPADEVIAAMKQVGDAMSASLKETAQGGLAATPTGRRLLKQVFGPGAEGPTGCAGCGGCQ